MSDADQIRIALSNSAQVLRDMAESCAVSILQAAELIDGAVKAGGKVLWCGNGGSAAQAQHLSTELVAGLGKDRNLTFRSVSLTVDTSFLTAWSNDVGFDTVFARQVEALGDPADVLVVLSASGTSPNILAAAEAADRIGMLVIALTGAVETALTSVATVSIRVPSSDTQRIQEGHIVAGHLICEILHASR